MKLILRDSEWLRGRTSSYSQLLSLEGKRCCLGVLCKDFGVSDEAMAAKGGPSEIATEIPDSLCWLVTDRSENRIHRNSEVSYSLMDINDDPKINDEERIEKLRPIFARHGIEIEFRPDE